MKSKKLVWDVFLSFSRRDSDAAETVKSAFEEADLAVFQFSTDQHEAGVFEDVRQALAESEAVVAIISENTKSSSWIAVEVGAALAWRKSLYVLRTDNCADPLPLYLRGLQTYKVSQVNNLITAILEAKQPFEAAHSEWLRDWYDSHGVPLDEMTIHPASLDTLAEDFQSRFGKVVPAERLLRELYRLRKRGVLPRVRRSKAS